jgi:hypothetical protein
MTSHSIHTASGERTFDSVHDDAAAFAPRHPLTIGLLFALCGGRPPGAYAVLAPALRLLTRAAARLPLRPAGVRHGALQQPRGDECARSRRRRSRPAQGRS